MRNSNGLVLYWLAFVFTARIALAIIVADPTLDITKEAMFIEIGAIAGVPYIFIVH
jgi:hypothetical protein